MTLHLTALHGDGMVRIRVGARIGVRVRVGVGVRVGARVGVEVRRQPLRRDAVG